MTEQGPENGGENGPSNTHALNAPPSEEDGGFLLPSATPAPTAVPEMNAGGWGMDGPWYEGQPSDTPAPGGTPEPTDAPEESPEPEATPGPSASPEPGGLTPEQLDAMIMDGATLDEIGIFAPMAFTGGVVAKENFSAVVDTINAGGGKTYNDIEDFLSAYSLTWTGAPSGVQDSGTFMTNFPQLTGYKVTGLSVNGINVVRIGLVQIKTTGGSPAEYVYYSAARSTGSMTSAVLGRDEKIQIAYSPEEYPITYQVVDENGNDLTGDEKYSVAKIFGPHRATTTQDQWLSVDVTIPAGHYGRVYIGDTGTALEEKFPQEAGYGPYPLGKEVTWKAVGSGQNNGGAEIATGAGTPSFFTLNGTYISGEAGSADAPQTVRVMITKRQKDEYSFDAQFMGEAKSGDYLNSNKWYAPGTLRGKLSEMGDKSFEYDDETGTFSCEWTLTLKKEIRPTMRCAPSPLTTPI